MIVSTKCFSIRLPFVRGITLIIALSIFAICTNVSGADIYPSKPIRMIVPFSPGGSSDIVARLIQPKLTKELGQQIVVDNRGGGNTIIGASLVAAARPDGYTFLLANATHTINAALVTNLPFDPIKDFVAISPVAMATPVLVVHASIPAKSVRELVSLIKAKPGQFNFASPGAGTSSTLAGVLLQSMAQLDFTIVHYKGHGPATIELMGGHVQMSIGSMPSMLPGIRTGKLRALAVCTAQRSALMPELPTIAESGIPGYEVSNWFGILSSKGTPAAIVKTLNAAFRKISEDAETQKLLAAQGTEPLIMSPEQFEQYIGSEVSKWTKIGAEFKLRVE